MTLFLGKEVTLVGQQHQVGDTARDFTLISKDLTPVSLSDFKGKKKVISIVPSVDTGICSTQTRTFNQELSELEDTVVITVSVDLPFAQKKWCGAAGLDQVVLLSDYRDRSFGESYGVLMEEWQLLARAVLVLDRDNTVVYTDYVENVNSEPDIARALDVVKNLD